MGVGAGLYMYDVVVKMFTFAISSRPTDEFLSNSLSIVPIFLSCTISNLPLVAMCVRNLKYASFGLLVLKVRMLSQNVELAVVNGYSRSSVMYRSMHRIMITFISIHHVWSNSTSAYTRTFSVATTFQPFISIDLFLKETCDYTVMLN